MKEDTRMRQQLLEDNATQVEIITKLEKKIEKLQDDLRFITKMHDIWYEQKVKCEEELKEGTKE